MLLILFSFIMIWKETFNPFLLKITTLRVVKMCLDMIFEVLISKQLTRIAAFGRYNI